MAIASFNVNGHNLYCLRWKEHEKSSRPDTKMVSMTHEQNIWQLGRLEGDKKHEKDLENVNQDFVGALFQFADYRTLLPFKNLMLSFSSFQRWRSIDISMPLPCRSGGIALERVFVVFARKVRHC